MFIFDKLFFFKGVIPHTGFFTENKPPKMTKILARGFYSTRSGKIWLDLERFSRTPNAKNFEECLSVLVHEMLHGFLMLYSCRCEGCLDEDQDPFRGGLALPHGGRGIAWAGAMSSIQQAFRNEVK